MQLEFKTVPAKGFCIDLICLHLTPDSNTEVMFDLLFKGNVCKGWVATLTPEAFAEALEKLAGMDQPEGWGGARPAVMGPAHNKISARVSVQAPWDEATAVPYALDYEQWCALRGYR